MRDHSPASGDPVISDASMRVTEADVASFHETGYLSIGALATADEIAGLIPLYDDLFDRHAGFDEGNYFDFAGKNDSDPALPQILMPSKYEPRSGPVSSFAVALPWRPSCWVQGRSSSSITRW